jgi:hypothetical protein
LLQKLSEGLIAVPTFKYNNTEECTKMQFENEESEVVLSLGKKEFSHSAHQSIFIDKNGEWVRCPCYKNCTNLMKYIAQGIRQRAASVHQRAF